MTALFDPDCPFCSIIVKFEEDGGYEGFTNLEYKGNDVYRITPLNPVAPGHQLFVPRQHVEHGMNALYSVAVCMQAAEQWGSFAAMTDPGLGWNLITSAGEVASQTVPHVHVHFVPRRQGDGLKLPWTEQKPEPESEPENCLQWNRPEECDHQGSNVCQECYRRLPSMEFRS